MLCCCDVGIGNAIGHHSLGCFGMVVGGASEIVVLCCVGCDLGWAMPLVWGCFRMVGPLQESAEAGCALQRRTRSAAAVTIAVDLGHP